MLPPDEELHLVPAADVCGVAIPHSNANRGHDMVSRYSRFTAVLEHHNRAYGTLQEAAARAPLFRPSPIRQLLGSSKFQRSFTSTSMIARVRPIK